MDSDTNRFDAEHATTAHPRMSAQELEAIYRQAWQLFYTPETYSDLATASDIADCYEGLELYRQTDAARRATAQARMHGELMLECGNDRLGLRQ